MLLSCKGRAVCASCGGRRMAERGANLVAAVLPAVPVRQWLLTVPHRLRYRLAFDHALCRAVVGIFVRAVRGWYRRRARRAGWADGHSGSVTVIQRFGSGFQLKVHAHALAFDGVFTEAADGTLRFHPAPAVDRCRGRPAGATIRTRVLRLLRRRGIFTEAADADAPDPLAETSLALAGITSAAVQGRGALGPRAGARVLQLGCVPGAPRVTTTGARPGPPRDGSSVRASCRSCGRRRLRGRRVAGSEGYQAEGEGCIVTPSFMSPEMLDVHGALHSFVIRRPPHSPRDAARRMPNPREDGLSG